MNPYSEISNHITNLVNQDSISFNKYHEACDMIDTYRDLNFITETQREQLVCRLVNANIIEVY